MVAAVLMLLAAIAAPAQTFATLYNFDNTSGGQRQAALIQGTDGNFYGTTVGGGQNGSCNWYSTGCGTMFKITPNGVLTTLYNFCSESGCADGANPTAPLSQAADGNFYGTTYNGGNENSSCQIGCGTVFRITPGGTFTSLYSFCSQSDCPDGKFPEAGLIQGALQLQWHGGRR
jgi:uncharacterized repeat protein (TIGR03803 family)